MPDYTIARESGSAQADEIQKHIDLQALARVFLGQGMPGGDCVTYFSPFDPDDHLGSFQVFKGHYRDTRNGKRGGAIRFVSKIRNCSYDQAIAFCEGWLAASEADG